MSKEEPAARPRDCTACRIVGSIGLIGIGGYLSNYAWKNKTFAGKLTLSTLSLGFVYLGLSRYKQTFPFDKNEPEDFQSIKAKVAALSKLEDYSSSTTK